MNKGVCRLTFPGRDVLHGGFSITEFTLESFSPKRIPNVDRIKMADSVETELSFAIWRRPATRCSGPAGSQRVRLKQFDNVVGTVRWFRGGRSCSANRVDNDKATGTFADVYKFKGSDSTCQNRATARMLSGICG